ISITCHGCGDRSSDESGAERTATRGKSDPKAVRGYGRLERWGGAMKVRGAADVRASQDALWAALTNPRLLARAVPGLDQIDFAGDGTCQFILSTTIAAVSGSYAGQARVVNRDGPGACVLRVSAAGVKGTVNADVTIRLAQAADGVTQLS